MNIIPAIPQSLHLMSSHRAYSSSKEPYCSSKEACNTLLHTSQETKEENSNRSLHMSQIVVGNIVGSNQDSAASNAIKDRLLMQLRGSLIGTSLFSSMPVGERGSTRCVRVSVCLCVFVVSVSVSVSVSSVSVSVSVSASVSVCRYLSLLSLSPSDELYGLNQGAVGHATGTDAPDS